jgi:polyferredoxin
MECVGCTACIDACNNIMDKLERPRGLIRYASENSIASGEKLHYTTRMKFYTGLCALVLCVLSFLLATRKDIDATIMRTPGMLYQERGNDSISNLYNIKMINKTIKTEQVFIKLNGGDGKVEVIGKPYITIEKEGQGAGSFFVVLPKTRIHSRKTEIKMDLYSGAEKIVTMKTNFLGPAN